jgi:hypothetical protein
MSVRPEPRVARMKLGFVLPLLSYGAGTEIARCSRFREVSSADSGVVRSGRRDGFSRIRSVSASPERNGAAENRGRYSKIALTVPNASPRACCRPSLSCAGRTLAYHPVTCSVRGANLKWDLGLVGGRDLSLR